MAAAAAASVAALLHQRERRGIRAALLARLVVIALAIPIEFTVAATDAERWNAMIGMVIGLVLAAGLLLQLDRTRRAMPVGVAAALIDTGMMAALVVGWWDSVGGAAVPPGLILKGGVIGMMALFIVLNAIALRPLYPAIAAIGMVGVYGALVIVTLADSRTVWTDNFVAATTGPDIASGLVAGELMVLVFIGALVVFATRTARRVVEDGVRLERANARLGRYFSPAVRDEISATDAVPDAPGGRRADVAVLFADIRNFTGLAEPLPPEQVMTFLSDYQSRMVAAVFAHGGTLDKFIGDAVMATFGTPEPRPDDAARAVTAAIAMRAALAAWNRERVGRGHAQVQHGIGIHYGPALVGNVGTAERLEYTVIGDTVNVAALIAEACKETGEELLISDAVARRLDASVAVRELAPRSLRGRREAVGLFAVEAGAGDVTAAATTPDFGREG